MVDRANYGRLKPVLEELRDRPGIELQIVCAGTMVLERFDRPVELVRKHGFTVDGEIFMELEGSTPGTMAKSIGFGLVEFAGELRRLEPDLVLIIGDRYEALAATIAAAYMNLPIVHLQGGEVSGSIDESARHAITKFAQFHVPATERARDYIVRMGERPDTILTVGCPSSDIAARLDGKATNELFARGGGATIDPNGRFILSIFHPVTSEFGDEREQAKILLTALEKIGEPTVLLWPNIDAGASRIHKTIRAFRDARKPDWLRVITNFSPDDFLKVLSNAACAVGNSSSFVRDAGFFGTPVVLVGNRQTEREHGEHAIEVAVSEQEIVDTVRAQLAHGRYAPCTLYGDGHVSSRIVDGIETLEPYVQKQLAY